MKERKVFLFFLFKKSFYSFSEEISHNKMILNEQETKKKNSFLRKKLVRGYSKIHELKLVTIGIASPEKIQFWAEKELPNGKIFGEVTNANTFHYRTFKPSKGGLFCERIFGPLKDFECACGKRQRPTALESKQILEHKQKIRSFCPNCDVEYTWSILRRYQLGYIKLNAPVMHLWYFKTNPSYLSLLLNMKRKDLESLIYCTETITLENISNFSEKIATFQESPTKFYETWQKFFQKEERRKNFQQKLFLKKEKQRKKKNFFRKVQCLEKKNIPKNKWKNFGFNFPEEKKIAEYQEPNQNFEKKILEQNRFFKKKHSFEVFFHQNWKHFLFQLFQTASFFSFSQTNSRFSILKSFFQFSTIFLFHSSFLKQKKIVLSLSSEKKTLQFQQLWKSFFFGFEALQFFEKKKKKQQKLSESVSKEDFLLFLNFIPFYKQINAFTQTEFQTRNSSHLFTKIQKNFCSPLVKREEEEFEQKKLVPFYSQAESFSFLSFTFLFEEKKNEEVKGKQEMNSFFNFSFRNIEVELYFDLLKKKDEKKILERNVLEFFLFSSQKIFSFQMFFESAKQYLFLHFLSIIDFTSENFLSFEETSRVLCLQNKKEQNFHRKELLFSFFSFLFLDFLFLETFQKDLNLLQNRQQVLLFSSLFFHLKKNINSDETKKEIFKKIFFSSEKKVPIAEKKKCCIEIFQNLSFFKKTFYVKKKKTQSEFVSKYFLENFSLTTNDNSSINILNNRIEKRKRNSLEKTLKIFKIFFFHRLENKQTFDSYIYAGIRKRNGEKKKNEDLFLKKLKKTLQILSKKNFVSNKISTTASTYRWGNDSDWKYFAYSMSFFSVEIDDFPIFFYSFIGPNTNSQPSLFFAPSTGKVNKESFDVSKKFFSGGAGILEKFLTEYTSVELRKMVKQHQILLPKIQQSIRFLKQTAKKKKRIVTNSKIYSKA